MRSFTVTAALLAVSVNADLCSLGSQLIGGNWYCDQVETIQYTNWARSGTYQRITNMDSNTGACSSEAHPYSGSLAPLNDEISIHLRGPATLSQLAFYTPGSGSSKKAKRTVSRRHAHGHADFHAKKDVQEKRDVGDWVTAVIDGKTVSWANEWSGAPTPVADSGSNSGSGETWVTATINGVEVSWLWGASEPTGAPANAGDSAPSPPVTTPEPENLKPQSGSIDHGSNNSNDNGSPQPDQSSNYNGDWVQAGYYDSSSSTLQGITFLNHMGGQGSGVFDYVFGNSLSYASSDAKSGSATPQILNTGLGSNSEIVIMTDKPCTADACGYSRDGTVAMRGFEGDRKVFLFEIQMPYDGVTGFNGDMPALWLLNAEIPRTIQYGKQDCSCWNNNGQCGEFDLLEVLDSGNHRTKSTVHIAGGLGSSDWIVRPADGPIKVALVLADSKATIKVLDSSFDFSKTLTNSQIDSIVGGSSGLSNGGTVSTNAL